MEFTLRVGADIHAFAGERRALFLIHDGHRLDLHGMPLVESDLRDAGHAGTGSVRSTMFMRRVRRW
jgi:hypothetical protein